MTRVARVTNSLLRGAYETEVGRPMLDLSQGGQHGWTPNLTEWISNQAYVTRPLVCVVLEVPQMFLAMPDADKWVTSYKALFELHSRSIEGLSSGLSVDDDEHAVGGAGEMQQEFVNVTRERSNPRHNIIEKYGRPVQTLLDIWIRYGMMDPETKFALLNHKVGNRAQDLLADWYTGTNLYFEPCPLHKRIDKAWICTNMRPKGTGDITGKRDLTASQETLPLDIELTAITQVGLGVNRYAQQILDAINGRNVDPTTKNAFTQSSEYYGTAGRSAEAARDEFGYKGSVERIEG